jgi:signal transduction histidine kinase
VRVHECVPPIAKAVAERHRRPGDLQLLLSPAELLAPEDNFKKILEELIDNAFKFSEKGKPVTISSQMIEHTLSLTVTDHGRGLTPEQVAKVAPHMQFDRRTYEQQGAGLGLIIAKRLTELLGGQLSIESNPGVETSLRISFEVPWC